MDLNNRLKSYRAAARITIRSYDHNIINQVHEFPDVDIHANSNQGCMQIGPALWQYHIEIKDAPNGHYQIIWTIKLLEGRMDSAAVSVGFCFDRWSKDNYVLMPAAVYNGNRFEYLPYEYPPRFKDKEHFKVDLPTTITDIPRLNTRPGPSKIEQTTGDPSTPAIGFYTPHMQQAFLMTTPQKTRFGNTGMFVEENEDRNQAKIELMTPCVREKRQHWCGKVDSGDTAVAWQAGDEVQIHTDLFFFDSKHVQGLFDRLFELRENQTNSAHEIPFASAWQILEEKHNTQNWIEAHGFYAVDTTRKTLCTLWQLGWVGGAMITQPLLFDGKAISKERAMRNLDMVFTKTQAKSGFFYGIGDGEHFHGDGFHKPHPDNMNMIRKNADALYFFFKQFDLLEKQDIEIPQSWKDAARRHARAFVKLWDTYGQFGQFVDVETGDLLIGTTTSGSIAPAGLALAGRYFQDQTFMDVAQASAKLYYERDVKHGITNAGPGEILQAPDSESAFAMLESFAVLYELTRDSQWLQAAEEMARQCASWCVSYDYEFPPDSLFAKLGIHSRGAVIANAQNKHAAPGICTLSGDSLLKIFRANGNRSYLQLLRDIAHSLPQYMSRQERPISGMPPGWINERCNMSDWEGKDLIGEVFYGSCWPEVSLMLTWIEVPGLYIQPDTGLVMAIDHIDAKILEHKGSNIKIELSNPTKFAARVRTLIETSQHAKKTSLGINVLLNKPVIQIDPGACCVISLNDDGQIEMEKE